MRGRRSIALLACVAWLPLAGPAVAQEAVALAIEGWQQTDGKDGIVTFRCASSICAAGSVVSYKFQPHRPELTLAMFEKHHQALAEANRNSGRIRAVAITEPTERTVDGIRVLQIFREVDWDDGSHTSTIEARLIGPDKSVSLVSDSPKREWTVNNFEGFLRNLVLIVGIREP